jgi:hypothetical protein
MLTLTLAGALTGLGASTGALRDTRKDSGGEVPDNKLKDEASREFGRYSNEKLFLGFDKKFIKRNNKNDILDYSFIKHLRIHVNYQMDR